MLKADAFLVFAFFNMLRCLQFIHGSVLVGCIRFLGLAGCYLDESPHCVCFLSTASSEDMARNLVVCTLI